MTTPNPRESLRNPERALPFLDGFSDAAREVAATPALYEMVNQFLWEYVGDANLASQAFHPIMRPGFYSQNQRSYDQRLVNGITKSGSLVHVRQTEDISADRRDDFFVAIASLDTAQIDEYRVNRYAADISRGLEVTLTIATKSFDSIDGEAGITAGNVLEYAGAVSRSRRQSYVADLAQARIRLSGQGCWYKPFQGEEDAIGPLVNFTNELARLMPLRDHLQAIGHSAAEFQAEVVPLRAS